MNMTTVLDTIYAIVQVTKQPYEEVFQACQQMCASRTVPADMTVRAIYQQTLAGKTLEEIQRDFSSSQNDEQMYAVAQFIVGLHEGKIISQDEALRLFKKLQEHYNEQ